MTDQVNFLSTSELVGMSGLAERWEWFRFRLHRCPISLHRQGTRPMRPVRRRACWLPSRVMAEFLAAD